jgi:hypothetical protein
VPDRARRFLARAATTVGRGEIQNSVVFANGMMRIGIVDVEFRTRLPGRHVLSGKSRRTNIASL